MRFWKGQALGNDYLVVDGTGDGPPTTAAIRFLCDRHRGVGSDGVLVADLDLDPVGLRIFNPDGTEAEKSGNGLRIFGAWLHHTGRVASAPFAVALPGETVRMHVQGHNDDGSLTLHVDMGPASFRARDVAFTDPAADPDQEVVGHPLDVGGERVHIHTVSLGNPHCVVFQDDLDMDRFRRLGPLLQSHPAFANGVNVQFARVAGARVLEARIWERGAGETLASGSSACAVVAAARRAGRVEGESFVVRMEGGEVRVEVDERYRIALTGPAGMVFEGRIDIDNR